MFKPREPALPGRFGLARHRPPGTWNTAAAAEPVVGIYHQIDNARAFAAAVRRAERMGHRYGLRIETGKAAQDAPLIVFGISEAQGLFGCRTTREWPIGTLSQGLTEEVSQQFLEHDIPIAAELVSIVDVPDGAPLITILVLSAHVSPPRTAKPRPALAVVR